MYRHSDTNLVRFDQWAQAYDHNQPRKLFYLLLDQLIINYIKREKIYPQYILDIGCGTGRFLFRAKTHFSTSKMMGIDVSSGMINVANAKSSSDASIQFKVASADDLPFDDDIFDLALSTISFHYWRDPVRCLREIYRVMRPGGIFLLADGFIAKDVSDTVRKLYFLIQKQSYFTHFYTTVDLQQMFIEAGWHIQEQKRPGLLGGVILITVGERPLNISLLTGQNKMKLPNVLT